MYGLPVGMFGSTNWATAAVARRNKTKGCLSQGGSESLHDNELCD